MYKYPFNLNYFAQKLLNAKSTYDWEAILQLIVTLRQIGHLLKKTLQNKCNSPHYSILGDDHQLKSPTIC